MYYYTSRAANGPLVMTGLACGLRVPIYLRRVRGIHDVEKIR